MSYIEKVSVGGTQYDFLDKNIASIEATSTASKAYAVGEYLVVGGQLCKATAAIAQNDSLVFNTNIESTLVGDELQSLSNEIVPISDAWDVGVSYAVDDICIYNNTLYKCILAHTSSLAILPTDTTYWTATSVGGELSSLDSNITAIPKGLYTNSRVITQGSNVTGTHLFTAQHTGFLYMLIHVANSNNVNVRINDMIVGTVFSAGAGNATDDINNQIQIGSIAPVHNGDTIKVSRTWGSNTDHITLIEYY